MIGVERMAGHSGRVAVSPSKLQQKAPNLIHTSYYKNFFLLRTEITIDGERAQVGVNDSGWLTLNSRKHQIGITFDSLVTDVNSVLQDHGLRGVSNYWCEEVPLFELRGTSCEELEQFLSIGGKLWEDLASKIGSRMAALDKEKNLAAATRLDVQVESQLYLIVPNYENMDGRPILLTKANFTECMNVFGQSNLFDFGAIFRASRNNQVPEDKFPAGLAVLHAELVEVVNWYELGQALLIPNHVLLTINRDNPRDTFMCRSAMLAWWWNNGDSVTWNTLVQALSDASQHRLAVTLAKQYGVVIPKKRALSSSPASSGEDPDDEISALKVLITELRGEVEQRGRKLAKRDQSLKEAQRDKDITARRIATLKHKLSKNKSRIKELNREKEEIGHALRQTQFEFNCLYQMATRQMEETELKKQIISKKETEIEELKNSLKAVEAELKEAHHNIPILQESLQRTEQELEYKTKTVKEMRQNVNDLKLLLEMNHRVLGDYIMQEAAAQISNERYIQEVQQQRTNLRQSSKLSIREYEAFQALLEANNPRLKSLFQQMSVRKLQTNTSVDATQQSQAVNTHPGVAKAVSQPILSEKPRGTRMKHTDSVDENGISLGESFSALSCLHWEKRCTAPHAMLRGSAAVNGQLVFVIPENSNSIHRYTVNTNEWSLLPVACPHINPGLVFIGNTLTAVGGQLFGQSTASITCFNKNMWSYELPAMKHPHCFPSVQNYKENYVIVAGGSWDSEVSMVEVYSIHTAHWLNIIHLPKPFYNITSTICGDQYIVMDAAGATYSIEINSLVSFANNAHHKWKNHPALSTCDGGEPMLTSLGGNVLCVSSSGLHRLWSDDGRWVKIHGIVTLPQLLSKSIVCVVGEQKVIGEKLVVIGGYHPGTNYTSSEVFVAS